MSVGPLTTVTVTYNCTALYIEQNGPIRNSKASYSLMNIMTVCNEQYCSGPRAGELSCHWALLW